MAAEASPGCHDSLPDTVVRVVGSQTRLAAASRRTMVVLTANQEMPERRAANTNAQGRRPRSLETRTPLTRHHQEQIWEEQNPPHKRIRPRRTVLDYGLRKTKKWRKGNRRKNQGLGNTHTHAHALSRSLSNDESQNQNQTKTEHAHFRGFFSLLFLTIMSTQSQKVQRGGKKRKCILASRFLNFGRTDQEGKERKGRERIRKSFEINIPLSGRFIPSPVCLLMCTANRDLLSDG